MPDQIDGLAAPLPMANIDTDVIMPKRFLVTITREGLAEGAFADLRFDEKGQKRPDFVLNMPPWDAASILIVGDNFGCGSSREHAVWGLTQLGIKACIGTGFAGIFYDNARKNGLTLPIVSANDRDKLLQFARSSAPAALTINVKKRRITAGTLSIDFEMDDATQSGLLRGADETMDTLNYSNAIDRFEAGLDRTMRVHVHK